MSNRSLKLWFQDKDRPHLTRTEFEHERELSGKPRPWRVKDHKENRNGHRKGIDALAWFLVRVRGDEGATPAALGRVYKVQTEGPEKELLKCLWEVFRQSKSSYLGWILEMFGLANTHLQQIQHPSGGVDGGEKPALTHMSAYLFRKHAREVGASEAAVELIVSNLPPECIEVFWDDVRVTDVNTLRGLGDRLMSVFQMTYSPKSVDSYDALCFVQRDHSVRHMLEDMRKYSKVVFHGVSHQKLEEHIRQVLALASPGAPLPWKSVEICYAGDSIGQQFEGRDFLAHLRQSRHELAELLARHEHLPHLREVEFRQSTNLRVKTGCMFGDIEKVGAEPAFHVTYQTVLSGNPQPLEQQPTFRVEVPGGKGRRASQVSLRTVFSDWYWAVRKDSVSLGTFPDRDAMWDESASEWGEFCERSRVQQTGMQELIKYADLRSGNRVLEVAAGSGQLSRMLLEKVRDVGGSLTVLEASPVMLAKCRQVLGDDVRYALCHLPATGKEDVDIHKEKYDVIVAHHALPAVAAGTPQLRLLAEWFAKYLDHGGRVVMSAHNTVVNLDTKPHFDPTTDPLRRGFQDAARGMGWKDLLRRPEETTSQPFYDSDLPRAFEETAFRIGKPFHSLKIVNPFEERCLLWQVPAILNCFIDVRRAGLEKVRDVVNQVISTLKSPPESGRTVGYWEFVRR